MIYKHLNLQEEAEKCSEKILLLSPNTSPECQLLVSEFLNKGLVDKAFSTMREWSEEHSEDRMIFTKYLSLVKDEGDQDEVEKAIEEITKWLKGHPEDNIIRELYIVLIRDKGNQGQVEKAIEEITKWLKGHPEDNMICSDYLALVRDRCFLEEYIRPALGDAEQRMKKHGSHPLFQDYIPLVKKILKTKSEIEIDVELVKQFGYEIIDLWEQEDKARYNKWIINFADLLLLMGCLNEYERIYKMLHELNLNPETKSALRFRYGKKFLGEAMNPELTNDERIEKLRRAEVTFREVLEIHRGHYMAYVFLYITLKEEGRDNEAEKELKHAKWWFPLNVKMKELVLFSSIPSNYNFEHLLNRGIIPKEIKNDFDIKGNPLSRSATIKMIMRDRWEITDKSSAYPYYIVLIDKIKRGETNEYKLNTYGKFHPGRIAYKIGKFYLDFYSYKEAEYWLEMATKEEPEDFTNWWKSGVAKMELALIIEEKVSHKEAIDIYAEALSDLETALEKAGESLQLPASKDIPERIAKCRKHLLS
jgi:tetratricopeptide (TPR) repeat protein